MYITLKENKQWLVDTYGRRAYSNIRAYLQVHGRMQCNFCAGRGHNGKDCGSAAKITKLVGTDYQGKGIWSALKKEVNSRYKARNDITSIAYEQNEGMHACIYKGKLIREAIRMYTPDERRAAGLANPAMDPSDDEDGDHGDGGGGGGLDDS